MSKQQRIWVGVAIVVAFLAGWAVAGLQGGMLQTRMSGISDVYKSCLSAGFTVTQCGQLVKPML